MLRGPIKSAERPTIGPGLLTWQSIIRKTIGFLFVAKFRVFIGQLWYKQPRRHGGFWGLSPPKQNSKPPNWNTKHYKSVDFLSIFGMSSPPRTNANLPRRNANPSCWKLSGDGSGCKIHWILLARATNTILYDCTPVILFLYSERIQHRSTTMVWLTGEQGCEPLPWQAKCKNWAPFCSYFGIQYSFGFQ